MTQAFYTERGLAAKIDALTAGQSFEERNVHFCGQHGCWLEAALIVRASYTRAGSFYLSEHNPGTGGWLGGKGNPRSRQELDEYLQGSCFRSEHEGHALNVAEPQESVA